MTDLTAAEIQNFLRNWAVDNFDEKDYQQQLKEDIAAIHQEMIYPWL